MAFRTPLIFGRRLTFHRRTVVEAVALLAVAVAVVLSVGERLSAREWSANSTGRDDVISVMSFNALNGGAPASDVLDGIDAARPDIVCLQELTPELSAALDERLGGRYPHRLFEPHPDAQGIGIASRYPMSDGAVLALGLNFLPAVAATIRVGSQKVHVVCVHFAPPQTGFGHGGNLWEKYQRNERFRLLQVKTLLEHLETVDAPVLVLGDMNEWPGQAALTALASAGFSDACGLRNNRCGPTWPGRATNFLPAVFRIDYVLGRGVAFTQAAVLDAGGSDHYPVAARIRLRAQ